MTGKIRIGTRGSRLALVQTGMVADALRAAHPGLAVEIVEIQTSGDWKPADGETRLAEAQGGKGLFAKEIEAALLAGEIDCGVHSMKDMAAVLPPGLAIDHMLPREDPRDAFLSNDYNHISDMPPGSTIGTSSVRRQAFILARRPDLKVVPLRGNVPTRIEKLRTFKVDATLLACAGLRRLGLTAEIASVIEPSEMLPAAGQGAVGIETRQDDARTRALLDGLHDRTTGLCVKAERAALAVLDGSCHTPIGAHALLLDADGGMLTLKVAVCSLDGREIHEEQAAAAVATDAQAEDLGRRVGAMLRERAGEALLRA